MISETKIIFVDIDWTILNHNIHDFDYVSIEALKKAQENGYLIYLCTARPYQSVELTGLFDFLKPDGIVCTNGGVVIEKDNVIYSKDFEKEDVRKIIEIAHSHDLTLELSTEKDRFFTKSGDNDFVESFFAIYAEKKPRIKDYENENVSAILLFSPEEYDEKLLKEFPSHISIYRFAPTASDLAFSPNDKGQGIKVALESLGIDKKYAIGIGDDLADISMFENVGFSIAMGNAKEELKEKASFVTKTIDESGVKYALEALKII